MAFLSYLMAGDISRFPMVFRGSGVLNGCVSEYVLSRVQFLVMFSSLHLLAAICNNVAQSGFKGSHLYCASTKRFFHALIHGTNVATVRGVTASASSR